MKRLYTIQAEINGKNSEVFVAKPSQSEIEDAEFIYAQKFNQLLQEGFLSKAMMNKKFGDIGGIFSEKSNKDLEEAVLELVEARKRIEFYGDAKNLSSSQKEELDAANKTYLTLQKKILEGDAAIQSMFSKSADTKAEEHMIRWFILNSVYYVSEVDSGDVKKKQEFRLFDKPTFEERIAQLNLLFEEVEEFDSEQIKFKKGVVEKYFTLIGRVISIWYNGFGKDQESIEKSLEEFFPEDYAIKQEKPSKKTSIRAKRAK